MFLDEHSPLCFSVKVATCLELDGGGRGQMANEVSCGECLNPHWFLKETIAGAN